MTARHQIRVGGRRLGRDRSPIEATRAPTVGELLQAAREKKGVDLYRAERDTKIRARHLQALENGAMADVSGDIYTLGFLRNYALYLGLDANELVARWRAEQAVSAPATQPVVVIPPPQPIAEPRRGLTFTPGVFVAALLTIVMLAFAGYVGVQLLRFSQNPEVVLDGASVRDLTESATSMVISGTSNPGALVRITGADGLLRSTDADEAGRWTLEVPVSKGRNDFAVVAVDPETGRETPPLPVIATVPVRPSPRPDTDAAGGTTASAPPADATALAALPAGLVVTAPLDGLESRTGQVRVEGATDADSVLVTSTWLGRAGSERDPAATPPAGGPRGPAPAGLRAGGGTFKGQLSLPSGLWRLTIETVDESLSPASQVRLVEVRYSGLVVVVEARGGPAWVRAWEDGKPVDGGRTLKPGDQRIFTAKREVVISTGSEKATHVTVNGYSYGSLGERVDPGSWVIEKGKRPRPTR